MAPSEISLVAINNGSTPACAAGFVGPSGTKITYAADATGISLSPAAGATGMGSCNENLTFTDGTQVLSTPLLMQLNSGVSSIEAATTP
ncbi:MAG TPA: hypothetical protein VGR45_17290 [Stellaceae bacterium]|nr:hypothetical protein [Stellaceae bacterium]